MKGYKNPITNKYKLIEHEQSNTNVITHIANDIKLELSNGTLTLKAGSKVYVPNGFEQDGTTKKFDIVTIESDVTVTTTDNYAWLVYFKNNAMSIRQIANSTSGTTQTTGNWKAFYNTSTNLISLSDGTGTFTDGYSFPIAMVTSTNGAITSINRVFNGFGFIGSTLFALPNVSGLIPNGKNADGSYKVIPTTVNSVKTLTESLSDGTRYYGIDSNGDLSRTGQAVNTHYVEPENLIKDTNNNTFYIAISGTYTIASSKITAIELPTVEPSTIPIYKAVDLN